MNMLITLHRWAGATIGAILIVIGLSGVALVWEDEWIGLPGADDPVAASVPALTRTVETAMAHHADLTRITFAGAGMGLHQAAYRDGSGAYLDQRGAVVDQWSGIWGRPELWLFDLHHHLFAGETGKTITGIAGLAGVFFVISGMVIWWRTRKTFAFRLWPKRMTRSAIVRQHRDLGIVVAPVLFVVMLSGTAMVFKPVGALLALPLPEASSTTRRTPAVHIAPDDWGAMFRLAERTFPDAQIRRLQFAEGKMGLRMRQPFEWTPNGRSYMVVDSSGAVTIDAPDRGFDRQSLIEKYYPIHAGKVGGLWWKIVLTLGGIAMAVLGALACFSFWFRRR